MESKQKKPLQITLNNLKVRNGVSLLFQYVIVHLYIIDEKVSQQTQLKTLREEATDTGHRQPWLLPPLTPPGSSHTQEAKVG